MATNALLMSYNLKLYMSRPFHVDGAGPSGKQLDPSIHDQTSLPIQLYEETRIQVVNIHNSS